MKKDFKHRTVPVDNAVGMVIPHDITEIVKDGKKGPAFKKGHIIREEDIEHLKRLGKNNIYVLNLGPDDVHENDAANLLACSLIGEGVKLSSAPVEGKLTILATRNGLLKVNRDALLAFNMLGDVMCSTLHDNTPVSINETIAGTRLIPLISNRTLVEEAVNIAQSANPPVIEVKPLQMAEVGLVITGNEIYNGLIEDKFEGVLRNKLESLGSRVQTVRLSPDDPERIASSIQECIELGADLIVTSGGMSVDPDDVTRIGIQHAGATDIVYGTPVLPGAMFLSARIGSIPVLGLPACGMFHNITVFDLVLPRILAGESIGRRELAELGHGGLCRNCKHCQYPVCNFGK